MSLICEAHLPRDARTIGFVRYLRKPRRKLMGWVMFLGFIALNETRGVYVVAQFVKGWSGH